MWWVWSAPSVHTPSSSSRDSLQFTRQLLQTGNSVMATARAPSKAVELQELAGESSGRLTIMQLDVSEPQAIEVRCCACCGVGAHITLL